MKWIASQKDIKKIADTIVNDLKKFPHKKRATAVFLVGDLGSGKTTITQAVAKKLGIKKKIQSPTFPIVKIYAIKKFPWKEFVHIDAYRLTQKKESLTDYIKEKGKDPLQLLFVEWPKQLPKGTLVPHATISLSAVKKNASLRLIAYAKKSITKKRNNKK